MNGQINRLKDLVSLGNPKKSRIIYFVSGSENSGKTFILYNFIHRSSSTDKRLLLIDYSEKYCNKIISPCTEIFPEETKTSERKMKSFKSMGGLKEILIINSNIESYLTEATAYLKNISGELKESTFIINLPALKTPPINQFENLNEEIYIVTLSDPLSIINCYAIIKVMLKSNFTGKIIVVLNRIGSEEEFYEASENIKKAVGHFLNYHGIDVVGFTVLNSLTEKSQIFEASKTVITSYL